MTDKSKRISAGSAPARPMASLPMVEASASGGVAVHGLDAIA